MTARPEKQSRIGEIVGAKYRIVRMLAEGGMGVVYEAQHTVVKRRFAVKFLRPDLAERRDILARFQREAEAAGALESENVAAAVDFGIVPDGAPYIVMEYLVGESLAVLLEREGRLPLARAADLVSQASRGIQVAHASGIVHRDLKPQNLFVCRRDDGTDVLKVLDFGVAKLQAMNEMSAATRTGTILGTVAYMSPEQARGDKVIDHRADVYALGAILYELCSGQRPHPGDSNNAILHHISTHPAVPLESVQPGLPAGLVEVVAGALSSDAGGRPPSAEAFAQALAAFVKREVWPAPPAEESGPTRVALTSTLLAQEGEPGSPTPPVSTLAGATADDHRPAPSLRARPRLRVRLAAGAAMVLAGLVILTVLGQRRSPVLPLSSGAGPGRTPPPATPIGRTEAIAPIPGNTLGSVVVPPPPPFAGASQGQPAKAGTTSHPSAVAAIIGRPDAHPSERRRNSQPVSAPMPSAPVVKPAVPVTFDDQNPYK